MSSTKCPVYCSTLILKKLIHKDIHPMLFSYSEIFMEPNNIFSLYFLLLYVRHGGQVMETGDMPFVSVVFRMISLNRCHQHEGKDKPFPVPTNNLLFQGGLFLFILSRVHFSCADIVWSIPQVNKCFVLGWSKSDTHCCTSVLLHSDQITSIHSHA